MTWRSENLVDLSRRWKRSFNDDDDNDATVSPTFELPDDKRGTAIRSCKVFYDMATLDTIGKEHELKAVLMEEAMNKCGLDGKKYTAMYALSKWAGRRKTVLNLEEFQSVIERFSNPIRIRNRQRQRVDDYMANHGFRFAYTVDEFMEKDNSVDSVLQSEATAAATTIGETAAGRLAAWNEILDGLDEL